MFGLDLKIFDMTELVARAAQKAAFRNLGHAANRIMLDARASIEKSREESEPGQPPHTKGKPQWSLRAAIRYDATKDDAVIGPMGSMVGDVGSVHEFGGDRYGREYDERPFMGPALEKNLDRMADDWKHSVTS